MGKDVKDSTDIYVDNITAFLSLLSHPVTEGAQIGQAELAFSKSGLAGPDLPVVLYVPWDCTQEELFHDLSWHEFRLKGLWLPRSSLQHFLEVDIHLADQQSTGTSPVSQDCRYLV